MIYDKKTKSVADAVAKIMNEELKGKQHKIDVAEPKGKLTSADFKKLRSMKKEEAEQIDEVKLADLPKRTVKGKSYGADYEDPEGKDDADDKPAEPVKRGRGRPKGTFKRRFNTKLYKESFTEMMQNLDQRGLEFVSEMFVVEEPTNDEYTAEVKDAQEKSEGKGKKAEVAKPAVQAVKNEEVEQIDEIFGPESDRIDHHVPKGKKPEVPKKIGPYDVHLHDMGGGKHKVIAAGKKNKFAGGKSVKVGAITHMDDIQHHMDFGQGNVHLHTSKPNRYFMDEEVEQIDEIELTESTVVGKLKQGVSKINMHGLPFEIPKHTTNHVMNGKKYKVVSHTHDDGYSHQIFHGSGEQAKGLSPDVKKTLLRDHRKARNASFDEEVQQEVEQIDERHLTSAETKKKEEVVKSMKKKLSGFRERYGKRAKEVMYATATKVAKGSK